MSDGYHAFHAPRYAFLLDLLAAQGVSDRTSLLDVGPSRLTAMIRERFGARVDTLGLEPDAPGHHHFDLNRARDEAAWRRGLPRYDVVVMAEILEHLHTAPQRVLAFVRTLLADGGLLIVQTPNAAALPKRLKLLFGRNPYEMLRADPGNPGHFREYTLSELAQIAGESGFRVERCLTDFYFDARFAGHGDEHAAPRPLVGALKNALYPLLPAPLREGITLLLRTAA